MHPQAMSTKRAHAKMCINVALSDLDTKLHDAIVEGTMERDAKVFLADAEKAIDTWVTWLEENGK